MCVCVCVGVCVCARALACMCVSVCAFVVRVELNGLITRITKVFRFFIFIICIYRIQDVTVWNVHEDGELSQDRIGQVPPLEYHGTQTNPPPPPPRPRIWL